jgi:hypothetical protein
MSIETDKSLHPAESDSVWNIDLSPPQPGLIDSDLQAELRSSRDLNPLEIALQDLKEANPFHRKAVLRLCDSHNNLTKRAIHMLSELDPMQKEAQKLFDILKSQIPKDGRVRVISTEQLKELLKDGSMQRGMDFAFARQGARLGHNGRYICVLCKNDSTARFDGGAFGSSEINLDRIPLKDLVLYIPQLPKKLAQAAGKFTSAFGS